MSSNQKTDIRVVTKVNGLSVQETNERLGSKYAASLLSQLKEAGAEITTSDVLAHVTTATLEQGGIRVTAEFEDAAEHDRFEAALASSDTPITTDFRSRWQIQTGSSK